jgi:hypothetical protein
LVPDRYNRRNAGGFCNRYGKDAAPERAPQVKPGFNGLIHRRGFSPADFLFKAGRG